VERIVGVADVMPLTPLSTIIVACPENKKFALVIRRRRI
jgi:hypothetical protein